MPKILFLPENRTCFVDEGTPLHEAAEQAGVGLTLPCGCKGVCGKCLVKVENGAVDYEDAGRIPPEQVAQGYVLACRSRVGREDADILVVSSLGEEEGQFSDAEDSGVEEDLYPEEEDRSPLASPVSLEVAEPQMLDGLGDYDRFAQAAREALGVGELELPPGLLRQLPDVLREQGGRVTAWCRREGDRAWVVDVRPGEAGADYGLAVDIGTTTVAMQLVEMPTGRVLHTVTRYNAQIDRGLDVISRINYAKTPERVEEMRQLVLSTLNRGIGQLCEKQGVGREVIRNVSISANTTMVQLFLGINPEYIRLEPYTPAVFQTPLYRAGELGVGVNPHAFVWMGPNVGSYVGGDITSGLLCTDFARDGEEISLFIDVGTNGEIVVGNNDFLMGCACSAGPAFEGGGIEKGMRASKGAIDSVAVDPETGACTYTVIGGEEPKGICGSGLICLAAQLFAWGIIDPRGKLDRSGKYPGVEERGKNARFYVAPPGEGSAGVYITESDIDNLIRAKAAIFSACVTMLDSVGLDFDSVSRFYIAGGFGRYLNIGQAQTIGLLPSLEEERYSYIGNSSLAGTYMALMSARHRAKVAELAGRITYVDLSTEPGYMDEYVSAMFLPHTNEKLFPDAKRQGVK